MMSIWIRNYVFSLLLASSAQALAQYDELIGACVVMQEDLILGEHIMSLHTGRVPLQNRAYIRSEVIRVKSSALRRENPLLGEREAKNQSELWLQNELDELENQDQEDLEENDL